MSGLEMLQSDSTAYTEAHNVDRLIRYPREENALRTIRRRAGLSHADVADKTGLSRLYIIRAEQGVYPEPSDRLVHWAVHTAALYELDIDGKGIRDEYRSYQRRCRQENGPGIHLKSPSGIGTVSYNYPLLTENRHLFKMHQNKEHPFRLWLFDGKYHLSVMQVCKAFCISPSILQRFVAQPYLVHTVPKPVREALEEAGYTVELLNDLEEAYKRYRQRVFKS